MAEGRLPGPFVQNHPPYITRLDGAMLGLKGLDMFYPDNRPLARAGGPFHQAHIYHLQRPAELLYRNLVIGHGAAGGLSVFGLDLPGPILYKVMFQFFTPFLWLIEQERIKVFWKGQINYKGFKGNVYRTMPILFVGVCPTGMET